MAEQTFHKDRILARCRRVTIKIGSSILSRVDGIHHERMRRLVDEVAAVKRSGRQVVLVSSGAVAAGLSKLGLKQRPRTIPQKQAAAAVGQIGLMALYEEYFAAHDLLVAQILLTHDDMANRRRYLNARHTFEALLSAGIIPVVNENDTVVVEEMRFNFGDNDNLSALVATLIDADLLVILSDVAGLYTANPHTHPDASLVPVVPAITPEIRAYLGESSGPLGTGGMTTKVNAAYKATEAGIPCIVANGLQPGVIGQVFASSDVGTLFLPKGDRLGRRKHWIAHTLRPAGVLVVDDGAYHAVHKAGRSLLPRGVVAVQGSFGSGDCVSCLTTDEVEFARGLVAYGSAELAKICGLRSDAIEVALGYRVSDEVIHRNDLVLLD